MNRNEKVSFYLLGWIGPLDFISASDVLFLFQRSLFRSNEDGKLSPIVTQIRSNGKQTEMCTKKMIKISEFH